MKLTDFCILFGFVLIGIFWSNEVRINILNDNQISQILLNKNMDEIVVDGLDKGFVGTQSDGKKQVELDVVSERIFSEMSVLFYGKNNMKNLVEKYITVMIYVEEDGYSMYHGGQWLDKELFAAESSHSERVEVISSLIEDRTDNTTLISYNDGESYKNTIDDNTLIIVYCGYSFKTSEFDYKNSYISAATIKQIK